MLKQRLRLKRNFSSWLTYLGSQSNSSFDLSSSIHFKMEASSSSSSAAKPLSRACSPFWAMGPRFCLLLHFGAERRDVFAPSPHGKANSVAGYASTLLLQENYILWRFSDSGLAIEGLSTYMHKYVLTFTICNNAQNPSKYAFPYAHMHFKKFRTLIITKTKFNVEWEARKKERSLHVTKIYFFQKLTQTILQYLQITVKIVNLVFFFIVFTAKWLAQTKRIYVFQTDIFSKL
jgi:hypothetical protein